MAAKDKRFTVYDMMAANGMFEANRANQDSPEYSGPQDYPKMLYHPEGKERITVPAEIVVTPMGPKEVGEQREIIWQIVNDADAEAKLVAEGWHDHPAKAMQAAGKVAPAISSGDQIARLQKQLADAQAALAKAQGGASPLPKGVARITTKEGAGL